MPHHTGMGTGMGACMGLCRILLNMAPKVLTCATGRAYTSECGQSPASLISHMGHGPQIRNTNQMAKKATLAASTAIINEQLAEQVTEFNGVALRSAKASVSASGISQDLAGLRPESIAYLLTYGWAKSLQDAAAGVKAQAMEAHKANGEAFEGMCKFIGISDYEGASMDAEAFGNRYADAKRQQRAEAIRQGTVGTRTATAQVDPIEKLVQAIAKERVLGAFKAKGMKRPDSETLERVIVQFLAKHGDVTRAEAEVRHSMQAATSLDDIEF